ncbi:MAG: hypothetical protein HY926_06090 [Elusimicrobia bacterium]|nr:hypothetical protein [Elusimicrobiota bacterium]
MTVWVEQLGLLDLLALWPRTWSGAAEIRYDEHRTGAAAARLLQALQGRGLFGRFRPAELTLAGADARGRTLYYRQDGELDRCLELFCERCGLAPGSRFRATAKHFLGCHLLDRMGFIVMVEKAARGLAAEHVLYLRRHPANAALLLGYRHDGFRMAQSFSWQDHLRALARPLHLIATAILPQTPLARPRHSQYRIRPSVWIEYEHTILTGFASRLFWKPHVPRDDVDFVFCLDRPETPLTDETARKISQAGYHWVDCHRPARLMRLGLGEGSGFLRRLLCRPEKLPFWLHLLHVEYELLVRIWTAVFQRFQVKLFIHHQEAFWKRGPQVRALEQAGGIMLSSHHSFLPAPLKEPSLNYQEHVYFVWGRSALDWVENKGHGCAYLLPCGIWLLPEKESGPGLPSFGPRVSFKLAVFDSSASHNLFVTQDDLAAFITAIIDLLEVNPSWGALIKPKSFRLENYGGLPGGPRLKERMTRLMGEGRLFIADFTVSPITVGLAMDLCACFNINSAGVVAAAHGARAVHWDCCGWPDSPLYEDPGQKVVYRSLADFKAALAAASRGDGSIGDFSRRRRWINHFDDTLAPARVGGFISDYLDRILSGAPVRQALDGAVAGYLERHAVPEDLVRRWPAPAD